MRKDYRKLFRYVLPLSQKLTGLSNSKIPSNIEMSYF